MKRCLFILLCLLSVFAINAAETLPVPDEIKFEMYFRKENQPTFCFVEEEPSTIPVEGTIADISQIAFPTVYSQADSDYSSDKVAAIALYWDVYGTSLTIDLMFSGSQSTDTGTCYMLSNTQGGNGYNYNVEITSKHESIGQERISLFTESEMSSESFHSPLDGTSRSLSLISNESILDGRASGSVTLDMTLPFPTETGFAMGQYTGTITASIIVED